MRVNLSVAIVYMVNNTAISEDDSSEEEANKNEDGPFVWDEAQQGVILGMFFYGYVVTQVKILLKHLQQRRTLLSPVTWWKNGRDCGRKVAFWCG